MRTKTQAREEARKARHPARATICTALHGGHSVLVSMEWDDATPLGHAVLSGWELRDLLARGTIVTVAP